MRPDELELHGLQSRKEKVEPSSGSHLICQVYFILRCENPSYYKQDTAAKKAFKFKYQRDYSYPFNLYLIEGAICF